MKGLQIDIRGKIMNCVTPKGQVCVFVEADNMVVLGEDKENSVKLDWGKNRVGCRRQSENYCY